LAPSKKDAIPQLAYMTEAERDEFFNLLDGDPALWRPLPSQNPPHPHPQVVALESPADVLGYGGAAGGGKSELGLGLALQHHQVSAFCRDNGTELSAINDRIRKVLGGRGSFNGRESIWRFVRDGVPVQIELCSFPNPGDEEKYRGRPHDLIVFDEAATMRYDAVRFLMGWLRTTDPMQRTRVVMAFNPPSMAHGRWVLDYFGPWLNKKHPHPAKPGELRWFATIGKRDIEVPDDRPFVLHNDVERVYNFDPDEFEADRIIRPESRTFIPSRVLDNPFLKDTDYMRKLQAMEEPFRSQLLYGDFQAGVKDDPYQVIPTEWVEAAQARWKKPSRLTPMSTIGMDVALGGDDKTVIARRHDNWFDEPIIYPGSTTRDGATLAGMAIAAQRDQAVIHIDLFGVGAQPYGFLMQAQIQVIGVNMGDKTDVRARQGNMHFRNVRSWLWWNMREALDPVNNMGLELPPSPELLADLTAPLWEMAGPVVVVESRDEIVKRIGRSPDVGTAYILAMMQTPKRRDLRAMASASKPRTYDPLDVIRNQQPMRSPGDSYDPFAGI
jgi:hypothetical protein